ncbi:MAG: MSMEG_4193 family putative phosphomutase [Actinomycetota bacterium]
MLLLLIRHGLTDHVGMRLSGWMSGVRLSSYGTEQARSLVTRLDGLPIDAVYSSPLDRARETAAPLARARKLRVRERDELGEVHYGGIEGKSLKVLAKSKMWKRLQAWPSDVRFPGGESLRETQARAVGAIETLREQHVDQTVAVVSHGDFIRLALAHYLGTHIDLYRRITVDPASVSAVLFTEYMPVIRCMNDTGVLSSFALTKSNAKGRR